MVQCKFYKSQKISIDILRSLYGTLLSERATKILLVTNSELTRSSRDFLAHLNANIVVWEQQTFLTKILNRSKNENWKFIRDDYDAKYIVFEFKNHSEEGDNVDKQSVLQISDYLKTTIGKFGIICSKKPPVNSGLEERKDVFINQGKLIIFITNGHLKEMLMRKYVKQDPADVIIDLIDKFNLDF